MVAPEISGMKIVRRVLWCIYAWPITLLLLSSDFIEGYQYGVTCVVAFAVLDFLISLPALAALHLHIWDRKLFNPTFWKIYTFGFYAWDLSFNLLIEPAITGEKFDPARLIAPIILIPFYVALFRYAFRQWKGKNIMANYTLIGGDQKQYGPVTGEQLRQWFQDGRVNAQTQARAEGDAEWRPLSAFSEFADLVGGGTAGATPSASPPSFPSGDGREAALEAVKGPAIALIVIAGLGVAYYGLSGLFTLATGGMMFHREMPPNIPPQMRAFIEGMQGPMAGVINLVIAAVNGFVLFGAINLLRLRNYGVAMVASIVAMLPCQCCCLLGLPAGIWALVVLNKPEVKSQFG